MAELRLSGLVTGIDTSEIVSQLMAVESQRLNMYEQRQTTWEDKKSALSDLESKLDALQSTVDDLSDADELRAFETTSSDTDILTAESSDNAFEGNHTVVINQLANAERWVHTNGKEYAEDTVGAGTFIYSYNHQETVITTTATTTLEDLVGLINNDANNPGVTASLLYHNGAYHLVLNGNDAGTDYKIFVNASNTEVRKAQSSFTVKSSEATLNSKIIELDQFSGTLVSGENITISGKDHNGNAISGQLAITSNTKLTHLISEINDAFDGRATATFVNGEIRLTDHTCGTSQMELTLTYNSGSGSTTLSVPTISRLTQGGITPANLAGFAGSDFTTTQTAQDSKIRVDGYPSTSAVAEVQRLTTTNRATAGNFTLTYDGYTTAAIPFGAATTDIRDALVALPNVSSGDITVSGSKLTVNGGVTVFTFLSTLGDVSLISINPSGLTPPDNSNYVMSEYTKGSDGWISRSSNTVDDVISGVTLHLHDTTDSNGEEITLTRDIESVKQKLNSMVTAYNAAVAYMKEKTGYNDILKKAGILMGDYTVSSIESALYTPLIAQTRGFVEDIDTFLMSGQIGLELDGDGMLSFDSDTFNEAISEDYMGVLAVIGADKTGSSTSNTIAFYSASSDWTTAGTYNVKVTIREEEGVRSIETAEIKLSTEPESAYRSATFSGNIVTGNSSFDGNGDPVYPENGLNLTVDLSQAGTFTATVRVKQGFTGALEDALGRMLKTTTGSIQLDQSYVDESIERLQDRIDAEEERLTRVQERLVARYAKLESTLTLLQNQMSALGLGS